jgi:hypothetical protein
MNEETKACTKCGRTLSVAMFSKDRQKKDGLRPQCKDCCSAQQKAYMQTEEAKELSKERLKRFLRTGKGRAWVRKRNHSESAKKSVTKYLASSKYREAYERRYNSESGKAVRARAAKKYLASEHGKRAGLERQKRYSQTERGKEVRRQAAARMRAKYPERDKARKRISQLVADGRLPPARDLACKKCGSNASEYHHHLGYDKEHWFDVIPLCHDCHESADHPERLYRPKKPLSHDGSIPARL